MKQRLASDFENMKWEPRHFQSNKQHPYHCNTLMVLVASMTEIWMFNKMIIFKIYAYAFS